MKDPRLDSKLLVEASTGVRWTALTRAGADLSTIATWDPHLDRRGTG